MGSDGPGMNLLSADIWKAGSSYPTLEDLVVIGPYPSADFFRALLPQLRPRRFTLVVDAACDPGVVETIRGLNDAAQPFQVRFAWCGGIVHAKLYYLRWRHQTSGSVVYKLIWGSLNASHSGFHRNAETLSHVTLRPHKRLNDYFLKFEAQEGRVDEVVIPIERGVTLVLPGFSFTSDRIAPQGASFDTWIQNGMLSHKYERDAGFLRFGIKLKKRLPADFVKRQLNDRAGLCSCSAAALTCAGGCGAPAISLA